MSSFSTLFRIKYMGTTRRKSVGRKRARQQTSERIKKIDMLLMWMNDWSWSVINVININLFYWCLRIVVSLKKAFAWILLVIVLIVKYLSYPCLFDNFCTWEAWVQSCIQMASIRYVDTDLNDCRFLRVEARTLVKARVGIGIAPVASIPKARR